LFGLFLWFRLGKTEVRTYSNPRKSIAIVIIVCFIALQFQANRGIVIGWSAVKSNSSSTEIRTPLFDEHEMSLTRLAPGRYAAHYAGTLRSNSISLFRLTTDSGNFLCDITQSSCEFSIPDGLTINVHVKIYGIKGIHDASFTVAMPKVTSTTTTTLLRAAPPSPRNVKAELTSPPTVVISWKPASNFAARVGEYVVTTSNGQPVCRTKSLSCSTNVPPNTERNFVVFARYVYGATSEKVGIPFGSWHWDLPSTTTTVPKPKHHFPCETDSIWDIRVCIIAYVKTKDSYWSWSDEAHRNVYYTIDAINVWYTATKLSNYVPPRHWITPSCVFYIDNYPNDPSGNMPNEYFAIDPGEMSHTGQVRTDKVHFWLYSVPVASITDRSFIPNPTRAC
jgi:hypothetical protein